MGHFIGPDILILTQLSSIEAHGVDGLLGPQHCVKPSSSHTDHSPAFQVLGEHLHTSDR